MTPTLRSVFTGALLGCAALLANACVVHDDDDHHDDDYSDGGGYYATVDADFVLDTVLGEGAGVFVEYGRGGVWTVWTSCDTLVYGNTCAYQINVVSHATIDTVDEQELEGYDEVELFGRDSFTLFAETATHLDMVQFTTEPGALVEMEVILDGLVSPDRFVWYGNGVVHEGAPESPVVFQPDVP